MANCIEQGFVKGTKEYDDCVKARKQERLEKKVSKTILDPINISVKKGDKEVSKTSLIRINDDYDPSKSTSFGGKIYDLFSNLEFGPKTTVSISEDVTIDNAFFTMGNQEGKNNLENLFEGIDGLSVSLAGGGTPISGNSVNLNYTDKDGNVTTSEDIKFGSELYIPDSDDINKNMGILSSFLDKNVDLENEKLLGFLGIRKEKIEKQRIVEQEFLNSTVVNKINKDYDNPDLFLPKKGSVRGIAAKFNITGEKPYEKEIKEQVSIINQKIASGQFPPSEQNKIEEQAQKNVRETLRVEALTKAKRLFYAERSNSGLDMQSDDFVNSLLLSDSLENEINDNFADGKIMVKDQNATHDILEIGANIINGKNNNPLSVKLFEEKVAALGIEKPKTAFTGSVMSGEKTDIKWDIMTQEEFVAAGNPLEQEDVTLTNGVKTTRTVLNLQKQLFDNYNARKTAYNKSVEKRTDLIMKLEDADLINDIASKSYDDFKANITTSGLTGADLVASAGYLTSKLLNNGLKYNRFDNNGDKLLIDNNIDRALDQLRFDFKKTTNLLENRLRDRVVFDDAFTNPTNFGKFLIEESFVQLPILLSMAFGGTPAAYIMGASGKYSDMKYTNYTGDSNYDAADLIWMPAAYGMAEGVFAQVSTVPILRRFKQRFKGSTGSSDLLTQGAKEWTKENWKRAIVYDPLLEWGAESLTQGSQNLIDGKPFLENMDHAGFSGFSISLMMGSSSMAVGMYQSSFSSFDQRQKIRAKQLELNSLGAEWNNLDKRSKEAKIIETQLKDVRRQLKIEIEKSAEMSNNNIREGHAKGFIDLIGMQSQLQADARAIVESKTLSEGYKKVTLANMETEYNAIDQLKAASLEGNNLMKYRPEFVLLEKTNVEEYNSIIEEATSQLEGKLDGKEPTPDQIKRQGYEVYLKRKVMEMNAQAGKNGELLTEYPTVVDALMGLESDNLTDEDKAKARDNIMKGANGWTSKNGRTNVIVDNQVANQKKNTAVHEIGHKVFWQILKNNEQAFKPIADQLLSDIQNSNPDIYEEFVNSVERGADGRLLSQEVIMNFLEFAADGKVGKNNTIKGMFGSILQKVFNKKYNFDFKGEKDINVFVTELGKKIKDGTLSKEDVTAASKNESITTLTPYNMFSSENKSDTAFSKGDGFANANIANELNLTNSTKNIVEKNNKVFDDIVDLSKLPENKGVELKDLVTQKMKNDLVTNNMPRVTALAKQAAQTGQNINLEEGLRKTFDDFNGEYALKLTELANSWNPAKNDSFGAYMNQLLPLKYSGILAKLKKGESDQTIRIDESTTQIADVSTSSSVDTVIEPKIDPLTFLPDGKTKDKFVKSLGNALKDATPEQLKNVSFANPIKSDKLLNEFADMFNLLTTGRDGKVKNPLIDKSFNFSDVNNLKDIQRQIIKNYQNLRNSMPKGNETVFTRKGRQGLVKEGGGSLALTTKFLNEYYTRLPKKISNNVQYKPKELTKNEWLAPLGIIDGKVDPNYTPRAGQAQTLKGMFDAIYKNVASQAADAQLKIDQQLDTDAKARAKANVRSGKSDLVFSNSQLSDFGASARTVDLMKTFRDGNFKNMTVEYPSSNKSIAKRAEEGKLKFDETDYISSEPRFIKDDNFKDARSRWLKKIVPLLNQDLLESSLIAGGPRSMFGKLEEVYDALGIKIGKKTPKQLKKEAAEFFSKTAPKIPTNFNYSRGKYAEMSPDQLRNHFNSKEFKANEKLKMPFLKDFAKVMQITMKNDPEAEAMWAGFLASTSNMSKGIIRRMAPIKFFSLISQQKSNLFVEEHSMPANNIAKFLFYIAKNGTVDKNFSFIKDNYFQGQLRKLDDDKLKGPWFNYISTMPKEFFTMENLTTWIRYNNENVAAIDGGINFDTYEMVDTGKTVSQQLAQQAMDVVVAHVEVNNVIDKGIEANKNKSSLFLSASPEQLNTEFNKIIEETLGIEADKRFSSIVAKRRGAKKGKFRPFVPPSAEDFSGLMYDLYGYGKMGEAQMKWVNENLIQPYRKGVSDIEAYRYSLGQDYKALLKKFPDVKKKLGKTIPGTDFTYDQALRVNLWTRAGYEIPGISKRDAAKLNSVVEKDPELGLFNDAALLISKQTKWAEPDAYWDAQSILSDLNNITTKVGRKQFLEQFIANKEAIFSTENMNKLEAALGNGWRNAMEDSLYRMENGTNRPSGTNALTNNFLNWVNNSIGAIMFFNRKSALLQTISSVNFLNWSDNNPVKAAMAFANFPQFLKDFSTLWNSSKLKQRRSGLKSDINESEIANAVKGAKDKASAMLSYLLKIGFTPTQLADSFAIASGGATFYRNRINTYIKQGMPKAEAETKAFDDFAETSDVSQQSADPMLISQQQASILGRLLLAFQNTPSQVTRLFKKAGRDFKNNRGDQKTNISKMVYYGAIQGFIFAALSNAYFMLADEEDPEDMTEEDKLRYDKSKETKIARILNSMTDTILRGSGVYGAIVATLKNTILTYNREENKNAFQKDRGKVILELANLSPPLGSKLRKINSAYKTKDYNKEITKEMGWDVTYKGRVKLSPNYSIFASLTEGFTNLPLERAVNEFKALNEMMDERNSTLQRIALALGYRSWDVGAIDEESDVIRVEAKAEKKAQTKIDQQKKRDEKKRLKELEKYKGKTPVEIKKMKQVEVLMKTNKPEQITTLLSLGLTKDEIKKLKYEEDRVNKIIQLQDK